MLLHNSSVAVLCPAILVVISREIGYNELSPFCLGPEELEILRKKKLQHLSKRCANPIQILQGNKEKTLLNLLCKANMS